MRFFRKFFCVSFWISNINIFLTNFNDIGQQPTGRSVLFSVVFTLSPPSHHGSVWLLPAISLLLTNTVSPVRAYISIWCERFHGTQKEDDRGPLSFQSSLAATYTAMGPRNQLCIGLLNRPASLCSLPTQFQTRFLESIPRPISVFDSGVTPTIIFTD